MPLGRLKGSRNCLDGMVLKEMVTFRLEIKWSPSRKRAKRMVPLKKHATKWSCPGDLGVSVLAPHTLHCNDCKKCDVTLESHDRSPEWRIETNCALHHFYVFPVPCRCCECDLPGRLQRYIKWFSRMGINDPRQKKLNVRDNIGIILGLENLRMSRLAR